MMLHAVDIFWGMIGMPYGVAAALVDVTTVVDAFAAAATVASTFTSLAALPSAGARLGTLLTSVGTGIDTLRNIGSDISNSATTVNCYASSQPCYLNG